MKRPYIFSKHKFRVAISIAGFLGLLYLIVNIFFNGGDEFVYKLNSLLVSPLARITTVSAGTLWRQLITGTQNHLLWGRDIHQLDFFGLGNKLG
jgi:hypothetical protein